MLLRVLRRSSAQINVFFSSFHTDCSFHGHRDIPRDAFSLYNHRKTRDWQDGSFIKEADVTLSQTYDNVIALALQCISVGNPSQPETTFYADTHFTFKKADGATSATLHHVYGSQDTSFSTWKTDDKQGIQIASLEMISHWNAVRCDVMTITTGNFSLAVLWYQFTSFRRPLTTGEKLVPTVESRTLYHISVN